MPPLIPITEQVWIPMHRIERISMFGTTVSIKYVDQRDAERLEGEDAQRLMMYIRAWTKPPAAAKAK